MPTLSIHTHWQVALSRPASQNLPKSMAAQPHRRKESTGIQHCISAIAGEVVKSRSAHLINFCGSGQIIALKSATALMCAESNERLKIVTQLFIRWWNRPTGVVLQGRASNHHKVLW